MVSPEHTVGSFRYWPRSDRWEWSDEVAAIHGYAPGTVQPTTDLILKHKHPDDVAEISALLDLTRTANVPFSGRYRIIDTGGRTHYVVVAGRTVQNEQGDPDGTEGFYIDMTDAWTHDMQSSADEAVGKVVKSRALIDQVKGMLMVVYGISAERAFDVLAWRSQSTNKKISALASQILVDVAEIDGGDELRAAFDSILLTAHERIPEAPPLAKLNHIGEVTARSPHLLHKQEASVRSQ
ncbi:PAS and ANTAR domain-containing protein [Hoyosella subflava]|uniref:ANTAR domain-containing protein n=1 Tax=Hoyosella subflava (strain DSM 45089 / JCM 17490 / NBRC 109087 / DQS3-9A1) TaxID=443218 RepID=F6EIT5_HOYSD|nr:PAS and ANTAR domain-containing protein [Hoyosella subflava]AEF39996.1 hypothetical protein AS9A_1547 [Hoyosella subflava DQS3-9A1]